MEKNNLSQWVTRKLLTQDMRVGVVEMTMILAPGLARLILKEMQCPDVFVPDGAKVQQFDLIRRVVWK